MATDGPEAGPSESLRSCDFSLHAFSEQPWSALAAALGRDYPLSDDKNKPLSNSYVHRFDSDYMGLFGFFPDREDFLGVVCDQCNKIVNPQRVQQHVLTYHSSVEADPMPPSINAVILQKPNTQTKHEHRSSESPKYNPDVHCGVITGDDSKPCMRSLNCKNHSSWMRRSVVGRSKSFNKLLAEHSQKHLSRDVKTNVASINLNEVAKSFENGTKNNHNTTNVKSVALPHLPQGEIQSDVTCSKNSSAVVNAKSPVPALSMVSQSSSQVTVNTSTLAQKPILMAKSTHENKATTVSVDTPSNANPTQNFSLPLTFLLSSISDLKLLKPAVTSTASSVPIATTVAAASIIKKQIPITSSVSSIPTSNHVRLAPAPVRSTANTAINIIHLRNVNSKNVYVNVTSVDYEQTVPRPSAICTFNGKKFRNQILFTPKIIAYKDAFKPVLRLNHTQSQPHSRPPLVSNYNNINSMNGSSMYLPHTMNGNGFNHNPIVMRMPSAPVSPFKPVMIGGEPTTLQAMVPKYPMRAHAPYNIQYQNGYSNGVCSPPAAIATTSLKRLNPYNIMNNSDDAKHTRTNIGAHFVLDDEDDLPNGKTDLTTLMELELDEP